jgi:hypothetical protein
MMSRSLWRGFYPPTTRPLPRSRNRLKECTLFVLRSQYVLFGLLASAKGHPNVIVQAEDLLAGDDLMIGKRIQFHEESWQELRLLAAESMKSFQELADEAFNDLLKKHGRPASLKEALRRSAGQTAKVIPLKRRGRTSKGRS